MLVQLPDECKQQIWRHLDAQELCRIACVSRGIARGANADAVWRVRMLTQLAQEQTRIAAHRTPSECGLQRQHASRNLIGHKVTSSRPLLLHTEDIVAAAQSAHRSSARGDDGAVAYGRIADDSTFWRDWYRDIYVTHSDILYASQSVWSFDAVNSSFEAAKMEISALKNERGELKEMLQAVKSKNQNDKQLRRIQMSCVRWMNRSHRRQAASTSLQNAQTAALSKAEITEELNVVEANIQVQSRIIFSLRSQYQKRLHRLTTQLARATQMLRDLGGSV
ncbi:hypothetical protein FI667_g10554, partial [Globisporangium splendens]